MDDVPASPASPEPRRPSLSVVVPVRNGGLDFEHCLRRLRDSFLADFELIVVDDGSTDDSADVARQAGAIVVRNPTPQGPAAARNLGARAASSPLIFFLDADVAVHPETLCRALARFDADPGPRGAFRLLRRRTGRTGRGQPVSQPAPSLRPSKRTVRRRHPSGPYVLDGLRDRSAGTSSSSSAGSTRGSILVRRSRISSSAIV